MSGRGRPIGRGRGVNAGNNAGNFENKSRGPSNVSGNGAGINIDNRGGRAPGYNPGNAGGNPWNKNNASLPVSSNNQQSTPRTDGPVSTDKVQKEVAPRSAPGPKQGQGDGQRKERVERRPPPNEIDTKPKEFSTKQGTAGKVVKLKSNYFTLVKKSEWGLYQYRVDMTVPEEELTRTKKQLLYQQRAHLGAYLFDGTVLYTINKLKQPFEKVSYRDDELKQPVNISIRLVGDVMLGDYHYFQVYGILIRKSFEHLKLRLIGRNFFDGEAKIHVPDYNLEILPGYVTSIRQHDGGVLMSAEISHKVMRTLTVYDVLDECYRRDSRSFQKTFANKIIGNVVITQYNNKTYRIDDIDFAIKPSNTFERSGVPVTYADYYNERYKIKIQNLSQPMLVHRATSKEKRAGMPELLYLVPELCYVTGLTDEMRLDFRLMQEVSNYTRVAPAGRIQKLLAFNKRLTDTPQIVKDFEEWNLEIDNQLIELQGRQLNPENITYGSGTKPTNEEADFTRELQSAKALLSNHLKEWVVVVPRFMMREAQNFVGTIIQVARQQGFIIEKPSFFETNDDRDLSFAQALSTVTDKTNPQLIAVCISKNQLSTYKTIKKKLCCDRSIPSQVMCKRSIANPKPNMQRSIATKIAIQLNCKTGGIPWSVSIDPSLGGLMIVGYDACHDPKARDKSIGAMVASLDQRFGRYFSAVTKHESGEELSSNLAVQLKLALKDFYTLNRNRLPTRIIIYRDGVGEGQIPFVKEHEIAEVRKQLEDVYERFGGGANKCRLGFVVVTKRINTRFFTMNNDNPRPGTVVDNTVTDPLKYDFFLVSQSVRQGTVAPTAYNIIDDNTGLTPNAMQALAYKFSHMYFNFSGTVRVPAPCQYAHKLALLVSQGLDGNIPNNTLNNSLYFL